MRSRHAKLRSNHISKDSHGDIVKKYCEDLVSMIGIAEEYGVSRVSIWKVLRKNGVDTRKGIASNVETTCTWCGDVVVKKRSYYRSRLHHFCCRDHYYLWLNRSVSPFIKHRHSLRIARRIVEGYFSILSWHVVHHEDCDQMNNSLENLRVFESQADHIRYHRGFDVKPVWDGRVVFLKEAC